MSVAAVIPTYPTSYFLVELEVWKTQNIVQHYSTEQTGKKKKVES